MTCGDKISFSLAPTESPTPPVSAPQPRVTQVSTSPTVLNTLTISDKTTQVVQLTSPERSPKALPKTSMGSFADMKVQTLLATAKELDLQVHNENESKSPSSGVTQTISTPGASVQNHGVGATASGNCMVQSDPSLSGVSTSVLDRTSTSSVQVTTSGAVLGRVVTQNVISRIQPAVHLKPGVHRIQPRQTVNAPITLTDPGPSTRPSQCISLTMPSMGVPLMPKANPLGDKYVC